jgi:hypothetical protein
MKLTEVLKAQTDLDWIYVADLALVGAELPGL